MRPAKRAASPTRTRSIALLIERAPVAKGGALEGRRSLRLWTRRRRGRSAGRGRHAVRGRPRSDRRRRCARLRRDPLTHRGVAGAVAFATGHEMAGKEEGSVDVGRALPRRPDLGPLYGRSTHLGEVMERLLTAGRPPSEPVAVIERGTWPRQRTLVRRSLK